MNIILINAAKELIIISCYFLLNPSNRWTRSAYRRFPIHGHIQLLACIPLLVYYSDCKLLGLGHMVRSMGVL